MTSEIEKWAVITCDQLLFAVLLLGKLTSSGEKVTGPEILIFLKQVSDVILVSVHELLQSFFFFKILIEGHQLTKDLCPLFYVGYFLLCFLITV